MAALTPESVRQLLRVLEEVDRNYRRGVLMPTAYQEAIRRVADQYGVTYQTIGDLCRRRLELSDISEFQHLLERWFSGDAEPLRRTISRRCTLAARTLVDEFLQDFTEAEAGESTSELIDDHSETPPSVQASIDLRLRLPEDLVRRIRLAGVAGIGSTFEETVECLLEAGFQMHKEEIRRSLEATLEAT